jgi:phosphate transport system permease protein
VGFTAFLLFPASALVVALLGQRALGDVLDAVSGHGGRLRVAIAALLRWVFLTAAAVALAVGAAMLLTGIGFDPRGGVVGTYVQRNTLVVGFAMGFAVIPIIYTIAEDALNSVPEHLRSASLACGATPWQTATRIILPTAASGVFAAIMIGMGRAVGETMIVVMAAGNTPILDWNIFNGLRALSANIAVELPEAVRDGTLYRMLFLAALTLFVMTFIVNTLAEVVRLRFRRRAAAL